ncbi:hypothetical protein E1176_16015 [Fulvivirga sp. RKSG066]|uniref:COG3014 family protein n=1 Tax=Fulvivirga aurantia TaxID=2529383 RepID=UPI0012BCBE11|nr:hypothetical protein [Fulvivirga aurantia]MTI22538.1 hypothetical protein [Fulvivirga aurantia]
MAFNYKPLIIIGLFSLTSCATYYEMNREFNVAFEQGNLEQAEQVLVKNKKVAKGKERFLYLVNRGVVLSMLGRFEESNDYFEQAYIYTEDYQTNYLHEAASYLTNPTAVAYKGEDHERLLLLYYKAINFLQLGMYNEALVECKRLNIRLQQLSDKYRSDNKYKEDAFIHNLMGIIYDAQKDYNNAFIAYRNAYEIYENSYTALFSLDAPQQLKEDILRTAYLTGFYEEYDKFKSEFGMTEYKYTPVDGSLVFFWNNGLGPYKSEWSINFAVIESEGGVFNFTNDEYDFTFPFSVPVSDNPEDHSKLTDLDVFRVAFPKYVERSKYYTGAELIVNDRTHQVELAEDINQIAFKTLRERMLLEFGKSLLRVALKKAAENQVEKESEGLALAVSFLNALTEKADTRNWQTLPHSIYYTRAPLQAGDNTVLLTLDKVGEQKNETRTFDFTIDTGQTAFKAFYSLEYKHRAY